MSAEQNLHNKYGNSTIAETMNAFAPKADGNDPVKYANELASAVGVSVTTVVSQLTPAQFTTLEITIAHKEGYDAQGNSIAYSANPQQ